MIASFISLLPSASSTYQTLLLNYKRNVNLLSNTYTTFSASLNSSSSFQSYASVQLVMDLNVSNKLSAQAFDLLCFPTQNFTKKNNFYVQAVQRIMHQYDSFQSCESPVQTGFQGQFQTANYRQILVPSTSLTWVIDNTLFPCLNGSYYPEVNLIKSFDLILQPNENIFYVYQIGLLSFVTFGAILLGGLGVQMYKLRVVKRQLRSYMHQRQNRLKYD